MKRRGKVIGPSSLYRINNLRESQANAYSESCQTSKTERFAKILLLQGTVS